MNNSGAPVSGGLQTAVVRRAVWKAPLLGPAPLEYSTVCSSVIAQPQLWNWMLSARYDGARLGRRRIEG
jgi:hypothetical protein